MIDIIQVDTTNKKQVNDFVDLHYRLYKDCPYWVPPFYSDIKLMLNRKKHPYYEMNDADFFIAVRDGQVIGRIAAMENRSYNDYHKTKKGQFYLFDCINDQETANLLFERTFDWCKKRGLDELVGPKGFSAFDGYGIQIEGFERRQMMVMMNYNYPYYNDLVQKLGFEKEVDWVSCYLPAEKFTIPEKAKMIAEKVLEKGHFKIEKFKNKNDLKKYAQKIGEAYNKTFINNYEYYPMTQGEVNLLLNNLLVMADPKLIKIMTYKDEIIGFLFAFPDISAALQRQGGRITPWGLIDFMLEIKRTKWVSLNGVGVLPEYHGRGGAALMYYEMEKTLKDYGFVHAELTNVAETATMMRKDLINLGGEPVKNHRIYHRKI